MTLLFLSFAHAAGTSWRWLELQEEAQFLRPLRPLRLSLCLLILLMLLDPGGGGWKRESGLVPLLFSRHRVKEGECYH